MWQQIFLGFAGICSGVIIAGGAVGLMIGLSIRSTLCRDHAHRRSHPALRGHDPARNSYSEIFSGSVADLSAAVESRF